MTLKPTTQLRKLLSNNHPIVAPCAYDSLTAKLIEHAGFPLCGTTGYGIHGAKLGTPDTGLLTLNEELEVYNNICDVKAGL